jgi:hypothetical protein
MESVEKRQPASIWLAGLSSAELQGLVNAGEPVWYKVDPGTLAAGGVGQVVVRLRQTPQVGSLSVGVVHSGGDSVGGGAGGGELAERFCTDRQTR